METCLHSHNDGVSVHMIVEADCWGSYDCSTRSQFQSWEYQRVHEFVHTSPVWRWQSYSIPWVLSVDTISTTLGKLPEDVSCALCTTCVRDIAESSGEWSILDLQCIRHVYVGVHDSSVLLGDCPVHASHCVRGFLTSSKMRPRAVASIVVRTVYLRVFSSRTFELHFWTESCRWRKKTHAENVGRLTRWRWCVCLVTRHRVTLKRRLLWKELVRRHDAW